MINVFKHLLITAFMTTSVYACGEKVEALADNPGNSKTPETIDGKTYFSCTVSGTALTDNTDRGILDPISKMLMDSGENESYIVGVVIPPDLKAGETCTSCRGYVHQKIKHEDGPTELRIYKLVQQITVTLSARNDGYASGTFSFTVKLKEDSDTRIEVTDGKFGMNIINDN
jgi:hypothetical protein